VLNSAIASQEELTFVLAFGPSAGGFVMTESAGDDLQKKLSDLQNEKAMVDAEKALAESKTALDQVKSGSLGPLADLQNQKALADAQKALAESQRSLDQAKNSSTGQLADLQNQKALADAQKALAESQKALDQSKSSSAGQLTDLQNQKAIADAQKAIADSQTQSMVARLIGDVKAGPYSGSVDTKPNAGTEEALLLAARAVKEAADEVAKAVTAFGGEPGVIHIFAAKEFPNFQRLLAYRFRKELVKQAFAAAGVAKPEAAALGLESIAVPALASAGLDAFSKMVGFFKTDFTVGSIDVKLDESLLLYSVAGKLKNKEVHLPLVYAPIAQNDAMAGLASELLELVDLRGRAATQLDEINDQIVDLKQQAADQAAPAGGDNQAGDEILGVIAGLKPKTDRLTSVIALYDVFANSLTTVDANGSAPISGLVLEYAADKALQAGAGVLLLRLENTGGGYLVKKNLLTGLGVMPLFHMGGATVTYLLLAGNDGKVLAGDAVAIHGGFVRTDRLKEELQK
jgi:hypothetical protein